LQCGQVEIEGFGSLIGPFAVVEGPALEQVRKEVDEDR